MIDFLAARVQRRLLFWAFNASVMLFLVFVVVAPIVSHFSSQSDVISEKADQLSQFQTVVIKAKSLMDELPQAANPFLSGQEERVVSADLQANLRSIVGAAGVRFLSIRGLPSGRPQQTKMVAVELELEGALPAIHNVIEAIENQTPFLFVTSALFRNSSEPSESLIRTELTIQGALHDRD